MLGVERGKLIGKLLTGFIFPEDQDVFYFHRINLSETCDRRICEIRMKKADGTLFHAQLESIPAPKGRGSEIFRTAMSDISERVRLEDLGEKQKMTAVKTLAAGIAHEFNNCLFPIIGFTEMVMDTLSEESLGHKHLRQVIDSALRIKNLIQKIVDFSRVDDKRYYTYIDLRSMIEHAFGLIETLLPPGARIQKNIDAGTRGVKGDPLRLYQVFKNLCLNACHAMEETAEGVLKVGLTETDITAEDTVGTKLAPGVYLLLTVSDNGRGMTPKIKNRVFEPFFTTKPPGKGTGMGLATAYGIVRNHGGDIRVWSEPGRGSVFYVYLPVGSEK